ncbi:DNA-3-methyladenine glycosylase I [Kistimonas asteriae]|uniref:DNA-3-methyladenine glycosylase I n=1 Tax=Kistimonas asteriae TaxID=517724 RepID=UPI001BADEFB0|nr:DNA-3-methyladenine glycosylase I [Kistimonas asteriae]
MNKQRCEWCTSDPLYQHYHDHEWGRPVHDDRTLFELLILEGAQAGLNWLTVLKKREGYRAAFDNFDAEKIARYDQEKIETLMADSNIIRNRLKILSAIKNARAFLTIVDEFGSFNDFMWQFVNYEPRLNHWSTQAEVPVVSQESETMSKKLKKQGFSFIGPTICYAYMQSSGMINDHTQYCFLYHGN